MAAAVTLFSSSGAARADDIRDVLERNTALFSAQRQVPAVLEQVIADLRSSIDRASDATQKYDAYLLLSRALYFKGMHAANGRAEIFMDGRRVAEAGIAHAKQHLNDQRAECYYFKAINMGRWGEAVGILDPRVVGQRHDFRRAVIDAMHFRRSAGSDEALRGANGQPVLRFAKDGTPGVSYDGYGPWRSLGRMYNRLPGFFGGDNNRAETILRDAVRLAPRLALNHVYLAQVLADLDKKDEARALLDRLLANDPATLNPDRVPETADEFIEARRLRADIGG